MAKALKKQFRQVAALAWKRDDAGELLVALVTSRDTRRWILPKGWPIRGMTNAEAAETEAMEEAGVIGRISSKPVGRYVYEKRFPKSVATVTIAVYPMEVTEQLDDWPEKAERDLRWCPVDEAAEIAADIGLRPILVDFAAALAEGIPDGIRPKKGRQRKKTSPAAKKSQARPSNKAVDK